MKQFTVQHGNGSETIECDKVTMDEGGRINFITGDNADAHLVASFASPYVHSIREVKQEHKPEEKKPDEGAKEDTKPA